MSEGHYRTFAPLEKFPADWPNALAAHLAPFSNLNLAPKNLTTVMAPVDTQPQLSLGVDGLWRHSEIEIDAAVPAGAAQTFDIVATTTANVFKPPSKEGEGESDETNYAFALQVVTHNTLPSGGSIAAAQKVGEVDWDGAKITGIRQLVGNLRSTDPLSPKMPITSLPAITATGIAAATAPVVRWSAPEGSNVILELLQGAAAKLKVTAAGLLEWPGGPTLHPEGTSLVLTGKLSVSEAATLSAGGTSTTPAEGDNSTKIATTAFVTTALGGSGFAPLASPVFTGAPKAPTAAADTNTTQLATTAYVLGQASNANPVMDEVAEPGVSTRWARADHKHASDVSRASRASPTFTGEPAGPTPPTADNSTRMATTAFVKEQKYAPLASPELTGAPLSTTPPLFSNNTKIATAAYADRAAATILNTAEVGSGVVNAGEHMIPRTNGSTWTVPATAGATTAVTCPQGLTSVIVAAATGKIYGDFAGGVNSVTLLTNQHVVLRGDGENVRIIAGEPKRTQEYGVATFHSRAEGEAGVEASATRPAFVLLTAVESASNLSIVNGASTRFVGTLEIGGEIGFELLPGQKWTLKAACFTSVLLK